MSSQTASLYFRSIDRGLPCHSKWRRSIRNSVHYPFYVWYCIRSIYYHTTCNLTIFSFRTVLHRWANLTVSSLPNPPKERCTDDFEGPFPHNVNLAAKVAPNITRIHVQVCQQCIVRGWLGLGFGLENKERSKEDQMHYLSLCWQSWKSLKDWLLVSALLCDSYGTSNLLCYRALLHWLHSPIC